VFQEEYRVVKCLVTNQTIKFTLGIRAPFHFQFPRWRYSRRLCRWFSTDDCPYALVCDKTLASCIEYEQTIRFGGTPAIPGGYFDA
jgi:hypothetical protein